MINNLHHFEILTNSSARLLDYLVKGLKLNLVLTKQTKHFDQFLVNSRSINFLITSLRGRTEVKDTEQSDEHLYSTPLSVIQSSHSDLYRTIANKQSTVFNAAFRVCDLDRVLFNCNRHNVPIIKSKHKLKDEQHGQVECAVIQSCIDGVVHSLFDLNDYKGKFLPGYETGDSPSSLSSSTPCLATHFDHLTYATPRETSGAVIEWYRKVFNMRQFRVSRETDEGLVVKTGDSGMNLKAVRYWMCAESGVHFDHKQNDFKFVISEPLEEGSNRNQISIFLEEHDGPGIQHIGLHTPNIFKSVQESKQNYDRVMYYVIPETYYQKEDKIKEIKSCGLDVSVLKDNHVLLDAELGESSSDNSEETVKNKYLLQVFTQPLFENKNTFFLEFIQRVGEAQGFGAANIKSLWDAVQHQIVNLRQQQS